MARAYLQNVKIPVKKTATFQLNKFFGGLNNVYSSLILNDNESPDLLNVTFKEKGILSKRNGFVKYFQFLFTETPKRIFIYEKRPNTKIYLISTDTKLYKYQIGIDTLPVELHTTARPIDGVTYQEAFLFVDGTGYHKYDGIEVTHLTNVSYVPTQPQLDDPFRGANNIPSDCTIISLNNERIYLSGSLTSPNVVYMSDLNNYLYFPTNAFMPPISNDDDYITAMKIFMDVLVIFKQHSVFALYGNDSDPTGYDPFSLKRINVDTGTMAYGSISQVENYLYYLGTNGMVYSLYPVQTNVDYVMGKVISEKLDLFKKPIYLTQVDFKNATSIYYRGHYYLSINTKLVLVYNFEYQCWSLWKGLNVTDFIIEPDEYKLLFVSTSNYIYEYGVGFSDDGLAISAYWNSKGFDAGYPEAIKQFRKMYVISQTSEEGDSQITVIFKVDFEETKQVISTESNISYWGEAEWGDKFITTDTFRSEPINVQKRGKILQIKILNNFLDQPMTVIEINGTIEIRPSN